MTKMRWWSTDPELNAALELDAKKLADMGVEGYDDCADEPAHDLDWALKQQESFQYDNDLPLYDAWAILRAEVLTQQAREPLVQEVLERYNALTACALNGQTSCENEDAALFEALRQLQDWRPE